MGTVYLGRFENRAESLVAVKTLRRELASDPVYRERFVAECHASRRVSADPASSAYVARLVDADPEATVPWLASEFIPGPTLHHQAARLRGLPEGELLAVARSLADVVHALHSHGFAHGDVKPLNIVLGPDGVRLVDLGLARPIVEAAEGPTFGSPGWSPPGHRDGDPASDVHGWGMSVAYAATGTPPFGRGSPAEVSARMEEHVPELVGVPALLRELVGAALAVDPAHRPSAQEVAARLRALAQVDLGEGGTSGRSEGTQHLAAPTLIETAAGVTLGVDPDEAPPAAATRATGRQVALLAAGALACAALVVPVAMLSSGPAGGGDPDAGPSPTVSASPAGAASAVPARSLTTRPASSAAATPPAPGAKGKGTSKGTSKGKGAGKKKGHSTKHGRPG
jgi:hypothetical protein